jgi:hypothetical protein
MREGELQGYVRRRYFQGCSKRLSDKAAGSLSAEAYPRGTLRWANDRERSQRPFSAAL